MNTGTFVLWGGSGPSQQFSALRTTPRGSIQEIIKTETATTTI